jgi:N-acetylneuraminate synthase
LEPGELAALCEDCRTAWQALGTGGYERAESEQLMTLLRRSLYAVEDIAEGEPLTARNVRSIRPSLGLAPKHYPEVLGCRATRPLKRGTPLDWSLMKPSAE